MNRDELKELKEKRLAEILEAAIPATKEFRLEWKRDKDDIFQYEAYASGYVIRISRGSSYTVDIRMNWPDSSLLFEFVHDARSFGRETSKLYVLCEKLYEAIQRQPDHFNRNCDEIVRFLKGEEDVADGDSEKPESDG